jgi:CheY-like chemotaxis protein
MAKILIVDDRPLCREFLSTLLKYAQHELFEASNGNEALNKILNEYPDLIITDLLMPTMNGYELVKNIKSNPVLAKIPVIFYTASFLLNEAKLLAETCDVEYVLYKPSEPQLILNTINEALQSHAAAQTVMSTSEESSSKSSLKVKSLASHLNELQQSDETFLQLSQISNRLLSMSELSLQIILERDPAKMLQLFCDGARKIMNSRYCFLGIVDYYDSTKIKHLLMAGDGKSSDGDMSKNLLRCHLIEQILNTNGVINLTTIDEKLMHEFPSIHPTIHTFLGTRLITPTHLYGFMYFVDKIDESEFSFTDIQIINNFSAQVAILYENIQLYDVIQKHATKLQIEINEREKQYQRLKASQHH